MDRIELVQRRAFGFEQRLLLGDEGDLRVAIRRPGGVRAYRVDLEELDSSPERVRERALWWVVAALLMAGVAALFVTLGLGGVPGWGTQGLLLGGAAMLLALVAGFLYFRQSVDVLAFCNRYTGQPRVALWHGRPDQASYIAFVEILVSRIRAAQGRGEDGSPSIADELRQLQQLVEEGALSNEEFEHTKRRLLGLGPAGGGREGLH